MKLDLTQEDLKSEPPLPGKKGAEAAASRAGRFFAALGANWLILVAILAVYILFAVGAWALRTEREAGGPMDIVFVFDTTGSMGDEMSGTVSTARRFVDRLSGSDIAWRLGLVAFGAKDEDPTPVVRKTVPFTDDVGVFRDELRQLEAIGGGQEDPITALDHALKNLVPRPGVEVVYILITDEPYAVESKCGRSFKEVKDEVQSQGIKVYAITNTEDIASTEDFQALARDSGGQWYDIHGSRKFTDILDAIAEDIATSIVR